MLKGSEKLLLIKPSSLGDIVHSLAFLNAIKESFPSVRIHWVVAKGFEDLLTEHPLIEKVIVINKDKWKSIKNISSTIKEFLNLNNYMKNEKYDITVDLQGLLRSGIITYLSGAPLRVGFKESREASHFCYNVKISVSLETHAVLRYLEVASWLGCRINSVKFPLTQAKEPEWLRDFENFIVVIPSARWQSKNWPLPYFVELVNMLPYRAVVVGSKSDEEKALKIEEYTKQKAKSFAGKTTLKELIAVFKKSLFVITPDTGTMHLAVACDKKVVAFFGPTDPCRTGPFGNGHLVIKSNESSSPCFKKYCKNPICMRNITPQFVYEEIQRWLKSKSAE